ncbi:MAG: anti-sigma factor antagonist [Planctomycetes bacterium]|nr:anti-sigma factor antagonist [Planctomycetota bacterium]
MTEGSLDGGPPLDAWSTRVRQLVGDGARWIVFDAAAIDSFVDCGHGALVQVADLLRQAGGGAILMRLSTRQRTIFKLLAIEHYFSFAETPEDALAIAGLVDGR